MDKKQLETVRQTLLAEREETLASLGEISGQIRDLSIDQGAEAGGVGNHLADDGSSVGEQETMGVIEDDLQERLKMIDAALARIEDGTYGQCRRCHQQIPTERIEALPFASFCVECQGHLERQNALYGSAVPPQR